MRVLALASLVGCVAASLPACRYGCGSPANCDSCTDGKTGFCLQSEQNCEQCAGVWCPVPAPPPAPTVANLKGVNQACADFGQALPGTMDTTYTFPREASIDHFASLGFGAVRIPFLWERLQGHLRGEFNEAYFASLNKTVSWVTQRGMHAIIDPHNYARYSTTGQVDGGEVIGATGSGVAVEDFLDFWTRLANAFKGDANVVFAIMNEPNTMSTRLWADTAQAAIKAIRDTGASNLVLVPGNGWTGAHSWLENWYDTSGDELSNAMAFKNFVDPGDNFAFEMHQYLDSDSSGGSPDCASSTIGADGLAGATQWLEENNFRAFLGEFAGGANSVCEDGINAMLTHMDQHPVWLGWTWWAAGPWWGSSWASIEPASDGSDKPQVAWLLEHLNSATIV